MDGEMGDGPASHPSCTGAPCASTPVAVAGLDDAVAIDGTWTHTCALRKDGTAVCWGDDRSGEIGDGAGSDTCQVGECRMAPVPVSAVSGLAAIATGAHYTLFLTPACELWGTGFNAYAQLGTGDTANHDAPVRATAVVP
jgi:alpha-tubulin suppressor-like RCC1 family protein